MVCNREERSHIQTWLLALQMSNGHVVQHSAEIALFFNSASCRTWLLNLYTRPIQQSHKPQAVVFANLTFYLTNIDLARVIAIDLQHQLFAKVASNTASCTSTFCPCLERISLSQDRTRQTARGSAFVFDLLIESIAQKCCAMRAELRLRRYTKCSS